jgi:hypothetical protein
MSMNPDKALQSIVRRGEFLLLEKDRNHFFVEMSGKHGRSPADHAAAFKRAVKKKMLVKTRIDGKKCFVSPAETAQVVSARTRKGRKPGFTNVPQGAMA